MRAVINHMIQLQDLVLIREEQKIARAGAHMEKMNASILAMSKALPADARAEYKKLNQKDKIVIVPVSEKFCAGCGMQLAVSLIQSVRTEKELKNCPQCARILYYPEDAPRRLSETRRRTAANKVGISRFSASTLMLPNLEATDKEGAIRELALAMETAGFVSKYDSLIESALQRESIVSTAVDHGVAFPHVRGVEGGGVSLALGTSKKGIQFDSPKGKLSKLIFFVVIPTAASAFYLKLLAGLAETLTKADARNALLAEKTPDKLWKALMKVTRRTIK